MFDTVIIDTSSVATLKLFSSLYSRPSVIVSRNYRTLRVCLGPSLESTAIRGKFQQYGGKVLKEKQYW